MVLLVIRTTGEKVNGKKSKNSKEYRFGITLRTMKFCKSSSFLFPYHIGINLSKEWKQKPGLLATFMVLRAIPKGYPCPWF